MMEDKQLGLGQYRLHQLLDEVDEVPRAEETRFLLEPGSSMADGTEQQKIAETDPSLGYTSVRYLGETGTSYDHEQEKLDNEARAKRQQAELTDYNSKTGIASD